MMYSEFLEGTGCKQNEHNYKLFRNLEAMYMNTNMSKQEIYEYGKKLADNSKSEAELNLEAEVKAKIESLKKNIESNKREIEFREQMVQLYKEDNDRSMVSMGRSYIAYLKRENKEARSQIACLRWVLE